MINSRFYGECKNCWFPPDGIPLPQADGSSWHLDASQLCLSKLRIWPEISISCKRGCPHKQGVCYHKKNTKGMKKANMLGFRGLKSGPLIALLIISSQLEHDLQLCKWRLSFWSLRQPVFAPHAHKYSLPRKWFIQVSASFKQWWQPSCYLLVMAGW